MATRHFCDGCEKEYSEYYPNLTAIIMTTRDATGNQSEVIPRLELCPRCLPQFKAMIEAYKADMKSAHQKPAAA
jgi:hypothetical protein